MLSKMGWNDVLISCDNYEDLLIEMAFPAQRG